MARLNCGLKDVKKDMVKHFAFPVMVEFLTQFIFTFWGIMTERPQPSIPGQNVSSPVNDSDDYAMRTFVPAFQTGLSAWICIMLYSKISHLPAQFNPAVTTTLVIVGSVPPILFIPNIIVQCLASVLAALASQLIRGAPPLALEIPDDVSSSTIFFNEVIMVASFTIIAAEVSKNPKMNDPLGALGFGTALFVCLLSGRWTGVICVNPARAFGPAMMTGGNVWNRYWLLWISDLIGSCVSALFWLAFLAPPQRSLIGRLKSDRKKNTKGNIESASTDDDDDDDDGGDDESRV